MPVSSTQRVKSNRRWPPFGDIGHALSNGTRGATVTGYNVNLALGRFNQTADAGASEAE